MDNMPLNIQMAPSEGQLTSDVTSLQSYSGIYQQQVQNSPFYGSSAAVASPGAVSSFFSKVGSVFGESAHLLESGADWVGRQAIEAGKSVVNFLPSLATETMQGFHTSTYNSQMNNLDSQLQTLNGQYKAGQINNTEYTTQLKGLQSQYAQAHSNYQVSLTKELSDNGQALRNTVNTIAAVTTVATAGLSSPLTASADVGTQSAAEFLTSKAADVIMSDPEAAITKLAADPAAFKALSVGAQSGIKASLTDTFVNAGAALTSKDIARAAVTNLAFKYPITFNWLSGTGNQLTKELETGKYGDALKTVGFNMALILSGGPIGKALEGSTAALKGVSGKMFGSTSFLDTLSKAIGDQNPNGIFNAIKDNPDLIKSFQALEATNMAATDNQVGSAVYRIIDGLKADGWDMSQMTHEQFVNQIQNWHEAQSLLTNEMTAKVGANEARKFVVGRWTIQDSNRVASAVATGTLSPTDASFIHGISNQTPQNAEDMLKNWNDLKTANPTQAFANNDNLDKQITKIINTSSTPTEADMKIRKIEAQVGQTKNLTKGVSTQLGKLGYVPIIPKNLEAPFIQGTQKLVTSGDISTVGKNVGGDFFARGVQPLPVLKEVGSFLTTLGLSPERSQTATSDLFKANLASNLEGTSLVDKNLLGESSSDQANSIMGKISNFVNETNKNATKFNLKAAPITDWRQLTRNELQTALGIGTTAAQATEISRAMTQSMLDISLAERGMGSKFLDMVQSIRPGSKLSMNGYLRIQGAGRFAWNPFFKAKLVTKTEILSQLEAGGKFPPSNTVDKGLGMIFGGRYGNLQNTADMLNEKGFFSGGYSNEATDETASGYNTLKSNLVLGSQKRSIAGLISSQAERVGMDVNTFADTYPNEVRDTVQSILHYNPKGDFINSPLARTLNTAFFPFRFNLKVAGYMARSLASQPPMVQVAVIHGMMQAHNFLTSTQGQVWYSQNADVIGLLAYFTPIETLSAVMALGNIGHESIGSLGELGGLPLGFIPQLLQAEGLWQPNQAYVNPKTGLPGTNYIPQSAKAGLATAISTFLGSLFTYPGSEAGFPSKTGALAKLAQGLTGSKAADWTKEPQTNLTPQQQQFEQTIQGLQQSGQGFVPPPQPNGGSAVVPPTGTGTAAPIYTASEKRSSTKVKKANEPVSLLPGQTTIGQVQ